METDLITYFMDFTPLHWGSLLSPIRGVYRDSLYVVRLGYSPFRHLVAAGIFR